jgi:hypothetical protein
MRWFMDDSTSLVHRSRKYVSLPTRWKTCVYTATYIDFDFDFAVEQIQLDSSYNLSKS